MDINSGRLVADLMKLEDGELDKFMRVPAHLQDHAMRALDGRSETVVNLSADSPLAKWASKERAKNRKRNKIAKRSRARNRK